MPLKIIDCAQSDEKFNVAGLYGALEELNVIANQ